MLNKFPIVQSIIPYFPQLMSFLKVLNGVIDQINSRMCEIELKADGKEVKVKGRNPEEVEKLMQSVKNFTD